MQKTKTPWPSLYRHLPPQSAAAVTADGGDDIEGPMTLRERDRERR